MVLTMQTLLGIAYESAGDVDSALTAYERAMTLNEILRSSASATANAEAIAASSNTPYPFAVRLYAEKDEIESAFQTAERGRARTLLDQFANNEFIDFRSNADDELLNEGNEILTALREARFALDTEQIRRLENEYENWLIRVQLTDPQLGALLSGEITTSEQVQAQLQPNQVMIVYYLTDALSYVFLIGQNRFQLVQLSQTKDEIGELVATYRNTFNAPLLNADNAHPESLRQLYDWLIRPVTGMLEETDSLIIVPHQTLHYLPFAALFDGERYLVDDYTLTTLPSASTLSYLVNTQTTDATSALVLGNPHTDVPNLPKLPESENEAITVAALFNSTALIQDSATEQQFKTGASQSTILHLAAHGSYNKQSPLFSTLYLAPTEDEDGRLEAHEIYELDLSQTQLVVLSACESQVGSADTGDEITALNRAFLYAGTSAVIATLWQVDDAATAQLMTTFYTAIQAGEPPAQALRTAQQVTRVDYPNPYFWAGFVLAGESHAFANHSTPAPQTTVPTTPVSEPTIQENEYTTPSWIRLPTLGIVGLLLIVGGFVVLRRR